MNDAEYVLRQDLKEKKTTARSARAARTHCGKGGRVKLPSDHLSKKELEKMNGYCESYKMNEPMTWVDFQHMPDDLKVMYIKLLQQKFDVPGTYLSKMFGIGQRSVSFELRRLGICSESRSGKKKWKKDEFLAWISGAEITLGEVRAPENFEPKDEDTANAAYKTTTETAYKIPETGSMVFEGDIQAILASVGRLLEGAKVHLSLTWDVLED